jgi:rhodanese-related sulfurtransferase
MSVTSILPRQLEELRAAGRPVDLIDVRTPMEFRALHVAFARNLPLDQLDAETIARSRPADCATPLYVICHSGSRGRQACEKLRAAGLSEVVNVEGGTLAWAECGLPVIRGKKALSLERQLRITIGSLVLLGVLLGWFVHPALAGLAALMGAGLVFAGVTDLCPLAMLIARMPWNRVSDVSTCCQTAQPTHA